MRASGGPRDDDVRPLDGRHLSEDELNRFIDDDLATGARRQAADHLAQCDHCTRVLAELQLLASLLRDLPAAEVPRSFQLDPRYAADRTPAWRRWGMTLLPLLPAMRAGTLALAVALGGVTAYRVVDDQTPSRQAQEQTSGYTAQPTNTNLTAAQSTIAAVAPSIQSAPGETTIRTTEYSDQSADRASDTGPAEEADAGAAAPADDTAADAPLADVTTSDDQADESAQKAPPGSEESKDSVSEGEGAPDAEVNTAMIAMEAASPAASPTATPSPTSTAIATPTPTETPTAIPTQTPVPAPVPTTIESDDQSWLGWAQAALGILLTALGALVVGLTRMRRGMN